MQLNGIGSFPNDSTQRILISLSRPISHTVQIAGKKLACLECPQYDKCRICTRTIAVAHHFGLLSDYAKAYKVPIDRMVVEGFPSGAGNKDNERKNICKQTAKPPRDVSQYGDHIDVNASNEDDLQAPYKVILANDTKATTCFGCKASRIQEKASDPPPPALHDTCLRHMEHRVFKFRGETKIRITKNPEQVYCHPYHSCTPMASRENTQIG